MLIDDLQALADDLRLRAQTAPVAERSANAERLRRHVVEYVLPRATDADAPLVIAILGSTGSGKSSLLNGFWSVRASASPGSCGPRLAGPWRWRTQTMRPRSPCCPDLPSARH